MIKIPIDNTILGIGAQDNRSVMIKYVNRHSLRLQLAVFYDGGDFSLRSAMAVATTACCLLRRWRLQPAVCYGGGDYILLSATTVAMMNGGPARR